MAMFSFTNYYFLCSVISSHGNGCRFPGQLLVVSVDVKPKPLTAEVPWALARRKSLAVSPYPGGQQCPGLAPCPFGVPFSEEQ